MNYNQTFRSKIKQVQAHSELKRMLSLSSYHKIWVIVTHTDKCSNREIGAPFHAPEIHLTDIDMVYLLLRTHFRPITLIQQISSFINSGSIPEYTICLIVLFTSLPWLSKGVNHTFFSIVYTGSMLD